MRGARGYHHGNLKEALIEAALGLIVVLLLATQFAPRVYGIALAAFALAWLVQAPPWHRAQPERGG